MKKIKISIEEFVLRMIKKRKELKERVRKYFQVSKYEDDWESGKLLKQLWYTVPETYNMALFVGLTDIELTKL